MDNNKNDKLGPLSSVAGTLCFITLGIIGYMNLSAPFNKGGLIFGALMGFLFGAITKFFMGRLLSLLNRDIAKTQGKHTVKAIVKRCTILLFPYTVMAALASYFLGWAAAGVFFSAAVMNTGVAAAFELGKLKGRNLIRNNIATSLIASAVSFLWLNSSAYLKSIPGLLDAGITIVLGLMGVKK